ncbi:MAG: UPF0158 family protein [Bacteroidota bacterium]
MIPISDEQVTEIATAIRRGKEVYVHREHGRVLIADDPERNLQADPEVFEIIMQTVSTDEESYLHIERLSAEEAIKIMKGFVDRVRDQELWQSLSYALKRPRPFQTFKGELKKYPKSYDRWRAFRQKRYEAYVRVKLQETQE